MSNSLNDVNVLLGTQLYRVQRNWPAPFFNLKGICDVTAMPDGRIAVLRRAEPQIILFSATGQQLDHWAIPGLISAHYMRASKDGGLLIADLCSHVIIKLDANGNKIHEFGQRGKPSWGEPFNNPTCAVEDHHGRMYVTDGYGNANLHCFDTTTGEKLFTIGERGRKPAQFATPHGVVTTKANEVFVTDRENSRIQVFNEQGQWLREIDNVYKPMGIALLDENHLIVSDQTPSVSLFTIGGELLGRCRTYGVYGHGVTVATDRAIYIAEMAPDSITKLTPF